MKRIPTQLSTLIFSLVKLLSGHYLILLSTAAIANTEQKFDEKLAIFEAYVGAWEAQFEVAQGQPPVTDVAKWERALNGKALRTLHSINNGQYGGESLIFWDKSKNKLVFYYFTTADFYTQGEIEIMDAQTFVAYEDVSGESQMSKGITKVKSTSKLMENTMQVSTSYLKNGEWTTPQTRVYTRTEKPVVFK